MVRLIIKGWAMNPGGECEIYMKTFDVDMPEVEEYLSTPTGYFQGAREIVGAEIIQEEDNS